MGQCFCTALFQLEKHPNPKALTEKESVRSKKGMKTAPEPSDSESERYNRPLSQHSCCHGFHIGGQIKQASQPISSQSDQT